MFKEFKEILEFIVLSQVSISLAFVICKKIFTWLKTPCIKLLRWHFFSDKKMQKYLKQYLECLRGSKLSREPSICNYTTNVDGTYFLDNTRSTLTYDLKGKRKSFFLSELFVYFHNNIGSYIISHTRIFDKDDCLNEEELESYIKGNKFKELSRFVNSKFCAEGLLIHYYASRGIILFDGYSTEGYNKPQGWDYDKVNFGAFGEYLRPKLISQGSQEKIVNDSIWKACSNFTILEYYRKSKHKIDQYIDGYLDLAVAYGYTHRISAEKEKRSDFLYASVFYLLDSQGVNIRNYIKTDEFFNTPESTLHYKTPAQMRMIRDRLAKQRWSDELAEREKERAKENA